MAHQKIIGMVRDGTGGGMIRRVERSGIPARILGLLVALPWSGAVLAQEEAAPVELKPTAQWVLDYGEDRCRIARTFAARPGGEENVLYFQQHSPDSLYEWLIAGPAVPRRSAVNVQFGSSLAPIEVSANTMTFGKYDRAVTGRGFLHQPAPIESDSSADASNAFATAEAPPPIASIDRVEIEPGTRRAARFQLGDMAPVEKAMQSCMDDLVRSWGADPEVQASIVAQPKWINLADVAKRIQQHYPRNASRRGEQARIQLRLMIEADGTPSKCVRTSLTQAENFDNSPCLEVMEHARFEPARDAEGQAVRSYFIQQIRYAMP